MSDQNAQINLKKEMNIQWNTSKLDFGWERWPVAWLIKLLSYGGGHAGMRDSIEISLIAKKIDTPPMCLSVHNTSSVCHTDMFSGFSVKAFMRLQTSGIYLDQPTDHDHIIVCPHVGHPEDSY